MSVDRRLNEIIKQLEEESKKLKEISKELKSKNNQRDEEEIRADLKKVLDTMSALHEKANKILKQ